MCFPGDGSSATSARLNIPWGIAYSSVDNYIFFADYNNHRIRKVDLSTMVISTYVGRQTSGGHYTSSCFDTSSEQVTRDSFNNVLAKLSLINAPSAVAVDTVGNLYFAEWGAHTLKKVTRATSLISTLAGINCVANSFSAPAAAKYFGPVLSYGGLSNPYGVTVDTLGNVYFTEYAGQVVRMVTADGNTLVGSVAGNGYTNEFYPYSKYTTGMPNDGRPSTSIGLNYPRGLAITSSGDLYITVWNAPVIKRAILKDMTPTAYPTPSPSFNYSGASFNDFPHKLYYSGNNFGLGASYLSVDCPGAMIASNSTNGDARAADYAATIMVPDFSVPTAEPTVSLDAACPLGYTLRGLGNRCYSALQAAKSYSNAISACSRAAAGFVTNIRSADDDAYLNSLFASLNVPLYWIGLKNLKWSSGWQKSSFSNWIYKNSSYSCVVGSSGYKGLRTGWNTTECSKLYAYICEVPSRYSASPTLQPVQINQSPIGK